MSSRLAWSTEQGLGQPGLHSETLFQGGVGGEGRGGGRGEGRRKEGKEEKEERRRKRRRWRKKREAEDDYHNQYYHAVHSSHSFKHLSLRCASEPLSPVTVQVTG